MNISIIAEKSQNNVIGCNGRVPWSMPACHSYVNQSVKNTTVIMGRKAYEVRNRLPQANRNIIISTSLKTIQDEIEVFASLEKAIDTLGQNENVFVVGGQSIYEQTMGIANRLHIIYIHTHIHGDCFFPLINYNHWEKFTDIYHSPDAENPFAYSFVELARKH